MLGISPLGWIHALGSLPALPLALSMLWHHRRIDPRSTAGKAYFVFMLVGALTVFPLAHSGMSTGIAAVTLLSLLVGFGVRIRPTASRAALYVETITLSLTVFLLLLPAVGETLRRLPPSNPIATTLEAPVLRVANLALLSGLIIGLIVQVTTLRRSRAPFHENHHQRNAMTRSVALVTGASSGIGEATARRLHDAGFIVYGAARRVDRMAVLAQAGIRTLALDVTDEVSIKGVVAEIISTAGRIDVLVNNAGYGSYGALEDVPMQEARTQIEVNLFGLAHLTQQVLPGMRAQRSGTIINVSSMGGRFATPMGCWYHASKYAVEGLSDALRLELHRFGIAVVLVEPGSIQTEWGAIAAEKLRTTSGQGPYAEQANAVARSLERSSQPGATMTSPPSVIAKAVTKAATARRPRTRYRVGFGARPLVFLGKVLPDRMFDALIKRLSGVST